MRIAEFKFDRPRDIALVGREGSTFGLARGASSETTYSVWQGGEERLLAMQLAWGGPGRFSSAYSRRAASKSKRLSATSSMTRLPRPKGTRIGSLYKSWLATVDIASRDGVAQVRLTEPLPEGVPRISFEVASDWATTLATRNRTGALSLSQRKITELADHLKSAQQRGVDLQSELENLRSLNQTLELLALVASKTDNAVIILDAEHRVEWVNDSFVRMTGYENFEVRTKTLIDVFFGEDLESDSCRALTSAFAAGHGVSQEILHQRKDGRTYWASLSITPAFSDDGNIHRWIGIASDATRRRHAQEALRRAKEEAELASRVKSEFLANMSHEIRTPMNAIIGMSELALETELGEEQREYLTTVLDSAESLLRLLNDILDLSKIEAQKLNLEAVEFHLAETLRDCLKPFAFQARQHGVRLDLHLPLDVPERLVGDSTRLRQIIANLTGNAVKFTSEGSITLAVAVTDISGGEATLLFSVKDTGVGIPEERLQHIFEAFTQADSSTNRRFGGTGLGLTISTQLVELMNGRIWVTSEEGVGSTFSFEIRLPVATAEQSQFTGSPVARIDDSAGGLTVIKQQLRVLVADDNRANRRLARTIIEKREHLVEEATNGAEVLELLAAAPVRHDSDGRSNARHGRARDERCDSPTGRGVGCATLHRGPHRSRHARGS